MSIDVSHVGNACRYCVLLAKILQRYRIRIEETKEADATRKCKEKRRKGTLSRQRGKFDKKKLTTPTALQTLYLPPTQSQNPKTFS